MLNETIGNEYHVLDKAVWQEVRQKRGSGKGQQPIVGDSGNVYVGTEFKGKECRVYVKVD